LQLTQRNTSYHYLPTPLLHTRISNTEDAVPVPPARLVQLIRQVGIRFSQ
jgi:hypothetical protein